MTASKRKWHAKDFCCHGLCEAVRLISPSYPTHGGVAECRMLGGMIDSEHKPIYVTIGYPCPIASLQSAAIPDEQEEDQPVLDVLSEKDVSKIRLAAQTAAGEDPKGPGQDTMAVCDSHEALRRRFGVAHRDWTDAVAREDSLREKLSDAEARLRNEEGVSSQLLQQRNNSNVRLSEVIEERETFRVALGTAVSALRLASGTLKMVHRRVEGGPIETASYIINRALEETEKHVKELPRPSDTDPAEQLRREARLHEQAMGRYVGGSSKWRDHQMSALRCLRGAEEIERLRRKS